MIARRIFSDDEEAQRKIDAFEEWGRRQSQALANVSVYRLRNYDVVPVGMFGRWCTFGISLPRSDEDRMLMPFVDMATDVTAFLFPPGGRSREESRRGGALNGAERRRFARSGRSSR